MTFQTRKSASKFAQELNGEAKRKGETQRYSVEDKGSKYSKVFGFDPMQKNESKFYL